MIRALALLAVLLHPLGAAAEDFAHAPTGLRIAVPEGWRTTPAAHPRYDVVVGLDPVSGTPRRAGIGPNTCQAAWVNAAQNNRLTQEQINALIASPERDGQVRTAMGIILDIGSLGPFEIGDVRGTEVIGTPRAGPDAEEARVIISIAETPRGRMQMTCAVHRDDLASGMEALRRVRDGIRPPG